MEQIPESGLRIWRVLSWLSLLALLGSGAWWMFYLPTVGKGGLFLAAGAVLMPLFWEKIGVFGRMSWIAMLFLLLGVEYRAIDKEHHDNEIAQQKAMKAIGDAFNGVLTDQRNHFADLIQKSDAAFQKTTEQASAQFDATMTKAQENLNHMTGGKTYPLVVFLPIPLENTKDKFRLALQAVGESPLFDVNVTVTKLPLPAMGNATDFVSGKTPSYIVGQFTATALSSNRFELLPVVTLDADGQSDFLITTLARNGVFHEKLHVRKTKEMFVKSGNDLVLPWEWSCEIKRDKVGQNKRTYEVNVTTVPWQKTLFPGGRVMQQP